MSGVVVGAVCAFGPLAAARVAASGGDRTAANNTTIGKNNQTKGVTLAIGGNNAGAGKRGNMSSTPRAVMSDGMMGGQDSSSSGQCRRHRHNIHRQNRDARRAEQLLQPPRAAGDVPSYVDGRGGTDAHPFTHLSHRV